MEEKETILIVDDSALNRMVLIEILGKENYQFLEAENGQQAVELLGWHPEIDLLLDITMPEMDGFGVLEIMNQYRWIEEIPVIMISAEGSYTFVERAYDLGGQRLYHPALRRPRGLPPGEQHPHALRQAEAPGADGGRAGV